ncbi:MAG TPA: hypothetical protein VF720_14320, partial [Candidatus Eisenbacteria bacterium]
MSDAMKPAGPRDGAPNDLDTWLLAGVEAHYLGRSSFLKDFDALARGTADLAGAHGGLVFLAGRSDGGLPVEGAAGLDTVPERAALLTAARTLVRSAMSAGTPRQAEAATSDEGHVLPPIFVEPIVARGQSLGALVVFGAWHDDVSARMTRAARLAAHLVTERLLQQETEDLKRRLGAAEREKARLGPQAELGAATRDVAGASLRALADVLAFGRRVARELPP